MTVTAPLAPAPARPRAVRRPVVFEVVVLLFLLRVYDFARAHADVRSGPAYDHADGLLWLEGVLRVDVEHPLNRAVAGHDVLSALAVHWYQFLHIPVTMTVLAGVWLVRPASYRPLRTALVALNCVGLATFLAWPLAPPRLLPQHGFVDLVAAAGYGPVVGSGNVSVDQFGAMPSLHIAWAVWCAAVLVLHLPWRRMRHAAWLYPATTSVVVVVTANHYVLDVAAGAATAAVALYVTLTLRPVHVPAQRVPAQASRG